MSALEQDIQDIAVFADPYTEVSSKRGSDSVKVAMVRGGRPVAFEFQATGRIVETTGRKAAFPNAASLLASERFANLAQLAGTQLRAAAAKPVKNRIPASVNIERIATDVEGLASELQVKASDGKLKLLLIDGPAGVGKTFQIEQLVVHQAGRASRGEPVPPVLHVTSKGRRLSNLRDVLAAATQELNAAFFAKHVPMLVRRGLLVVAIDGFDELVDADGYEDSWLALRQFISEVGGGGAMVLAARDTFVEEQELLARIERSRSDVDLKIGEVLPPNRSQARQWLSSSPTWKPAELDSDVAADMLRDGSYVLRPFFLRELWAAKGWSDVIDAGPRTYLVNRLLSREAKLIAQQVGGTTAEQVVGSLSALLQEVAMEMAAREVDSVEVEHLSFLTQFCFDGVVDEMGIRKLMHKSGSLALLELTADKGSRRFPHSEVRYYFLGLSILKGLAGGSVPALLRRHMLNCEELEVFGEIFLNSPQELGPATRYCSSLLASEIASDALAPNLAAILIVMLALGKVDRVDFADVVEATFVGQTPRGIISSSKISRLDACGADMSGLEFSSVEVGILVVDDSTVIGRSLPGVGALEVRGKSGAEVLRGRKEISDWLVQRERAGAIADSPAVRLLEKVARRSVRHFYLRVSGDEDDGSALLNDPLWEIVSKVLARHARLEVHRAKPMHGRPSPLIRVKNPLALLDASDRETAKIFEDLVSSESAQLA